MKPKKLKVLAAVPTYDGKRVNTQSVLALGQAGAVVMEARLSLLARCFNETWCAALNGRKDGFTHFMMMHADIQPLTPNWVHELLKLSIQLGNVVSVVSPIKTGHGFTSTAMETDDPWNPRKLTLAECNSKPLTWTHDDLLINTGLMVVDLKEPWCDRVSFNITDRIKQDASGKWVAETQPEDWDFSRQVKREGGKVYATRAIKIAHWGDNAWLT